MFFSRSADPQFLHSFPTRRSSDLSAAERKPLACSMMARLRMARRRPSTSASSRWTRAAQSSSGRCPEPSPRSEEHTSELQSCGHLVCRLLLEKKKLTIYIIYDVI